MNARMLRQTVRAAVLAGCVVSARSGGASIPPSTLVQNHFDALYRDFRGVASERAVVLVELSSSNRLFAAALRDQECFAAFMRTNAKGVIINEVVRGKGAVRTYRSVAKQRWYTAVKRSLKPFYTAIGDRRGVRSLLWAEPIVITSRNSRRFAGVVAVKMDLAECFQRLAEAAEYPFRVFAGGRLLFSHRWETHTDYDSSVVEIPGLDNVVVCEVRHSAERAGAPVNSSSDTGSEPAAGVQESVVTADALRYHTTQRKLPVGRMVFSLLVVGAVAGFVRARIRHRAILREVFRDGGPA